MKALDKIYINVDPFGFINGYTPENHPPVCDEYISKDALLKFVKEKLAENVGQYNNDWDLALNSIIDKIESL